MNKIKELFFSDLQQIEKVGFLTCLFLAAYGIFLAAVNPHYYDRIYTLKGGLIGGLQQISLLYLMCLSFYRAYVLGLARRNPKILAVSFFFALLFLFAFCDKIRWGQYILGLQVSPFFHKYNAQGEMTIHNLKFGHFSVNKVVFSQFLALVVVLYTFVFPWLYARGNQLVRKVADKLAVPVPRNSQILWYLLIVIVATLIPHKKKWEVVQLMGVFSVTMFFAFPKNKRTFTS